MPGSDDLYTRPELAAAIGSLHTVKPSEQFKPLFGSSVADASCSICLEPYLVGTERLTILQCGHYFHAECIQANLIAQRLVCPECRSSVFEESVAADIRNEHRNSQPLVEASDFDGVDGEELIGIPVERVIRYFQTISGNERNRLVAQRMDASGWARSLLTQLQLDVSNAMNEFETFDQEEQGRKAARLIWSMAALVHANGYDIGWSDLQVTMYMARCVLASTSDSPLPDPSTPYPLLTEYNEEGILVNWSESERLSVRRRSF